MKLGAEHIELKNNAGLKGVKVEQKLSILPSIDECVYSVEEIRTKEKEATEVSSNGPDEVIVKEPQSDVEDKCVQLIEGIDNLSKKLQDGIATIHSSSMYSSLKNEYVQSEKKMKKTEVKIKDADNSFDKLAVSDQQVTQK